MHPTNPTLKGGEILSSPPFKVGFEGANVKSQCEEPKTVNAYNLIVKFKLMIINKIYFIFHHVKIYIQDFVSL